MNIKVYYPSSPEGKDELARRVASVHADIVVQYINRLPCSAEQKLALIEATAAEKKRQEQADG